jgi:hypothetical protein
MEKLNNAGMKTRGRGVRLTLLIVMPFTLLSTATTGHSTSNITPKPLGPMVTEQTTRAGATAMETTLALFPRALRTKALEALNVVMARWMI